MSEPSASREVPWHPHLLSCKGVCLSFLHSTSTPADWNQWRCLQISCPKALSWNSTEWMAVSGNRVRCVLGGRNFEFNKDFKHNSSIHFCNSFQSEGTPNPSSHLLAFIRSTLCSFFLFFFFFCTNNYVSLTMPLWVCPWGKLEKKICERCNGTGTGWFQQTLESSRLWRFGENQQHASARHIILDFFIIIFSVSFFSLF